MIRQIYMQVHTQLCRLGGASAAGNLNKQHHQVALREIDEWKHPGHLQADLAIPPLSSSNPPSREGPQPLLAKSTSKIVRESSSGSKTHPENVLRGNFRSASFPRGMQVSYVLFFPLLSAVFILALTLWFNWLLNRPPGIQSTCLSRVQVLIPSFSFFNFWGHWQINVFTLKRIPDVQPPFGTLPASTSPHLHREGGGCLLQPQAGALSPKTAFEISWFLQPICCLLLLLTYLVSAKREQKPFPLTNQSSFNPLRVTEQI